ncbi:DUF1232 domain-containing protein [Candidatus Synechococcus calcipolaris G9]|uniref:DUF1232 domain-containing protein n=1 Tax=Candidatus Synechococcus calcipolaris G9 TaxID=1497997 RepID=A0ABT6EZ09_9SYNE|nr:YkvA family protein [Candidatus Synechococcus calcipolaris]MDG2990756.1 DUF1232 domain-containing protein [Candidatus Synechococcus calcipolaris G9]
MTAFYNWYRNTLRHPKYRWFIIGGSLIYLLSPIDIAPDLIPIVGQLDDAAVLIILASEITQMAVEHLKNKKAKQEVPGDGPTVDVSAESI